MSPRATSVLCSAGRAPGAIRARVRGRADSGSSVHRTSWFAGSKPCARSRPRASSPLAVAVQPQQHGVQVAVPAVPGAPRTALAVAQAAVQLLIDPLRNGQQDPVCAHGHHACLLGAGHDGRPRRTLSSNDPMSDQYGSAIRAAIHTLWRACLAPRARRLICGVCVMTHCGIARLIRFIQRAWRAYSVHTACCNSVHRKG